MQSRTISTLLSVLPLLSISPSTLAETDTQVSNQTALDEIVISANRVARSVNETLVPVTIITREDIEKTQATGLADLLQVTPGISSVNSGGRGQQSSLSIRGANSDHVLLLIDGVKQWSASLGTTAYEHLPLDMIERIEIVRGPRSSLYGSEAIGGVIQIFTRKGGKSTKPSFKLGLGSNQTVEGNVNVGGGTDSSWYNLNFSTIDTQGIDACYSTVSGCFADEPDKDGYHRDALALRLGHRFSDKLTAELSAFKAIGEVEYDGSFQNASDIAQSSINAKLDAEINEQLSLTFRVGQSRDESDNYKDSGFSSRFDARHTMASLLGDIAINDQHNILLGTDWQNDKVFSTTAYTTDSRDNKGLFVSYLGQFDNTNFEAALRRDDNQQFGKHTTGSIALGHTLANNLRLKASYGTAFKAPTFNQLYYPGYGNSNLQPEESRNFELGIAKHNANSSWELNLFQNNVDNLIAGFPVDNTDETQIRGVEASYTMHIADWQLSSNLTVQNPENRSANNQGNKLIYRPEKVMNIDISRQFGRWNIGSLLHAESSRFSDASNSDSLPGFALLDLRAKYAINKDWSLALKANNVLDKEYTLNKGYNQDGINGMITIQYQPE